MSPDADLLTRRLERLRALDPRLRLAVDLPPPRPRERPAEGSSERGARLADRLGGHHLEDPQGSVVVVDRRTPLSFDLSGLEQLPYSIETSRPIVFLDTETTGLGSGAGTVAFLVGLGRWEGQHFLVRQLIMPDHVDEPALLRTLAAEIPPDAWLVTYNGRAFDWPLLVARYRLHRRSPPEIRGHLDLLPVARGLWKHRLADARLASVESGVAGVRRHGDLPGALIPDRYFGWLRSGRPEPLTDVLDHNRDDVLSLARLLGVLSRELADPARRRGAHPGDLAGLARAYRRQGRWIEALDCYDDALASWDSRDPGPSRLDRDIVAAEAARLLVRLGRHDDAEAAWRSLAERGGATAVWAWIAVAKHREHRRRDPDGAMAASLHALRIVERRRAVGVPMRTAEHDLGRRLRRLRRRTQVLPAA